MNRIALVALVLAVASLGCRSNTLSTSGTGGSPAAGGSMGTGGAPYLAGTGGGSTGGAGGTVGVGGIGGESGKCGAQQEPFFPWEVTPSNGSGDAGGVSDAGPSGCQVAAGNAGFYPNLSCSGEAWLRATGGVGGAGGPTVTWDDGSQLSWVGPASLPPPIAPGAPDERVWVQLVQQNVTLAGPYTRLTQKMDLRDSSGGPIRLMAWNGETLPDLTSDEIVAVFGVDASTVTSCRSPYVNGGASSSVTLSDHLLQTAPVTQIPYGQITAVNAPTGSFAVFWYALLANATPSVICEQCFSGPRLSFIASKVPALQ